MKKFLTVLLILSLVLSQALPAFAKDNITFDDLKAKYELKLVSLEELPEGVVPLEINSMAELKTILRMLMSPRVTFTINQRETLTVASYLLWGYGQK